jgi:hypothetical protein
VMGPEVLPLHLQTTISPLHDIQVGRTRSSTPSSSFAGVAVPDGFGEPLELEAIDAGRGGASVSDPPNRSSSPSSDILAICICIYCIYVYSSTDTSLRLRLGAQIEGSQRDAYHVPFTGKLGVFTLSPLLPCPVYVLLTLAYPISSV